MSAMLGVTTGIAMAVMFISDRFVTDLGSEVRTTLLLPVVVMVATVMLAASLALSESEFRRRTRKTDDSSTRSKGHKARKKNGDTTYQPSATEGS